MRFGRVSTAVSALLLLTIATGCDKKAPAPPFLDVMPSSTSRTTVIAQGTAEPSSTVKVTGPGTDESATADPYNGRFRFTLTLGDGDNTFSFTSTDKKGNVSESTDVTVTYVTPHPESLVLGLETEVVDADSGELVVHVTGQHHDTMVTLEGVEITLTVSDYVVAITPVTVTLDANNEAVGTLTGLVKTGGGKLTATATGGSPEARAGFDVAPGVPTTFAFDLGSLAAPMTGYLAGDAVPFEYEVFDANGNVPVNPVIVSISAPNAIVVNDGMGLGEILGVVRAGSYPVRARVVGSDLPEDLETLVIDPAPGEGFNVILSTSLTIEGGRALVYVTDAFGNAIDMADVTVTVDGVDVASHPDVSQNGNELTFGAPGSYTVGAYMTADPTISDAELISVQSVLDTIPPSATIDRIVYPQGTIVPTRGRIELEVTFVDNKALADGLVVAQFGALPGCNSNSADLVLFGATNVTTFASVRVPGCAAPMDPVTIHVRVSDQAGNTGFSPADTTLTMAAPNGFDLTANTPFDATVMHYQNRINRGDQPTDVAVDPNTGVAYMTAANNNRVEMLFPDRTGDRLRDPFRNTINFNQPEGIAVTADGHLFIGDSGSQQIDMVDPFLNLTRAQMDPQISPDRLDIDENGTVPLLCAAFPGDNEVRCYDDMTGTPSQQIRLTNAEGLNNPRAVVVANGEMWIVEGDCTVKHGIMTYTAGAASVGTLTTIAMQGPATFGNQCVDIASIPNSATGNEAVLVADRSQGQVIRVESDGTTTQVVDGLPDLVGIDFAVDTLYVLDRQFETLFMVTGAF